MADLDDFFAKKDRKKNKTNKRFSTTEEVAKKLEDNAKKNEIKKKPDRVADGDETNTPVHDQDEWKEFEEEKKDYTGLKIGNLTINQNNDGSQGNTESNSELLEGDDVGQQSEKKAGPWNRKEEVQEVVPVKVEEKKPVVKSGAYVPPSLRNQPQPTRPKMRGAPDVHNEELFPTLSKTNDHRRHRNEGSFEVVQHNKSSSFRQNEQSRISSSQGPKLTLGNRYNTLSHDS
ncbi:hypothetical protein WA026_018648 [Henosepilachna vigintioctopunctata]|uniref:Protein CDV3 homolog n=1 Tax=Henosepilachna vigintioctopunctata TaxID=420089 RepID=A0AAW1U141_9CUCU